MIKLETLKSQGYKIYITHLRNWDLYHVDTEDNLVPGKDLIKLENISKSQIPKEYHKYVEPRGGTTIVKLVYNGNESIGQSDCSNKDPFSHKRGVQIALGRALIQLHLNKGNKVEEPIVDPILITW